MITGTDNFGCLSCPERSVRNPASVWTADNTGVALPPPCVCAPGYQTGEEPNTYALDTSQSAAANYKAAQSSVASQVFGKCVDPLLLESFTTWLFSETLKYSALRPPEQVVPNPCFVGQTTPASTSDCNGLTRDQYTVPWVLPSGSPLQPKYWDSGDTQSNGELNGVSSHGLPTDLYAFNDASMQPRLLVIVNARGANWYLFPSNYWRLPAQGFRSLFMWENADITLDNANKLPYSRLSGTYPPPGCTPDADGNCFALYSQYTPDWSDPLPTDIELVQTFMISPLGLLTASSIHPLGLCLCLSEQCLIETRVCPSSPDPACTGWRLSHQFMYIMHVQSTFVGNGDGSYTCSFTKELQRVPLCFLGSEQRETNPKAYRRAPTECKITSQGTQEDQELVFQAKAIASFTQDGPENCLVGRMDVSWDDDSKYFFTSPWNAPCWEPKANDQGAPDPNTVPLETATFEWQNDEALQANQFAS